MARELFPHDRMHGTFFVMACLERLGRWSEIGPYLDEHLQLLDGPEAAASCPYLRGGPLVGALALARLGDVRRARELAASTPANLDHPAQAEVVRALLAIELGDAGTGRELAERLVRLGRRPATDEIPHETVALVEALEAQGDHDALLRFLPTARAASGYLAVVTPTCDRAEGLARAAAGDTRAAETLLTRAVAGFDRMSVPLQAARSREYLARVRPDRAEELLQRGASLVRDVGSRAGRGARDIRTRRGVTGGDQLQLRAHRRAELEQVPPYLLASPSRSRRSDRPRRTIGPTARSRSPAYRSRSPRLAARRGERTGQHLGVAQRVGDAVGAQRVEERAGVADQDPARAVGLPDEAGPADPGAQPAGRAGRGQPATRSTGRGGEQPVVGLAEVAPSLRAARVWAGTPANTQTSPPLVGIMPALWPGR